MLNGWMMTGEVFLTDFLIGHGKDVAEISAYSMKP